MTTRLIVGLGNPGDKYEHTRHNAGFRIVDALAEKNSAAFIEEKKFKSQTSAFDNGDVRVILAKPQTFMNESGGAVQKLLSFYKLPATSLLVVHDEIDLPIGDLRTTTDSGAAGHNGVSSIIESIGQDFARLRVGIENRKEFRIPPTDAYVLQNFTDGEETKLKEIVPQAVAEIEKFLQ